MVATRPGVFCTAKADGTLDVWDIFYKQNDPTLSLQVDPDGLRSLRMESRGSFWRRARSRFRVHASAVRGATVMQQNEKNQVMQMLERESKREKNLEARAKELRAKEKRAAEAANAENNTEGKESGGEREGDRGEILGDGRREGLCRRGPGLSRTPKRWSPRETHCNAL